ncbi:hypothetical protein HanOQP8_Chr16g0628341 [Helianthus annuus]|nr:hypothetical protein HanOQP8_Chr16g0628341 [Helianthus annuus]
MWPDRRVHHLPDALLIDKLMKIIGSDFFKIVPEVITTSVVAAGNYAFQVKAQLLHPNKCLLQVRSSRH